MDADMMMTDAYALAPRDGLAVAAPAPRAEFGAPVPRKATESKQSNRLLVYDGVVAILVENIDTAMRQVRKLVEDANGYMQSVHDSVIVFKIPAPMFETVLALVEAEGEVTFKNIVGEDVTDRMRDLGIRLKNAEQVRDRLAALLDRAEKVEDALKIETELGRITESIELLKGQMRVLEDRIAFSTLTVKLNSPLPQQTVKQQIPFPWVVELGEDLASGNRKTRGYHCTDVRRRLRFDLPELFAKYEQVHNRTRATSADGVLLKVAQHDNVDGGTLAFWTSFIRQALAARRAIAIKNETPISIGRKGAGVVLSGTKDIGGESYGYMVAVVRTEKHVLAYEAWGQAAEFEKSKKAILKSMATVKP